MFIELSLGLLYSLYERRRLNICINATYEPHLAGRAYFRTRRTDSKEHGTVQHTVGAHLLFSHRSVSSFSTLFGAHAYENARAIRMTRSKPGMQNLGASCRSPLAFPSFRDWFRTLGSLVRGFPSCKVWTNRRVIKMTASVQHLYFGGKLPWRVSIYGIQTVSVSFFGFHGYTKTKTRAMRNKLH